MILSTALAVDLERLTAVLDRPSGQDAALTETLQLLSDDAGTAVRSFLGLSVTVTVAGQDVTLTSMTETVEPARVRSILRVPLRALSAGQGTVVFYASRPDAFVALAADLRRALRSSLDTLPPRPAEQDDIRLEVWDPAGTGEVDGPLDLQRQTLLVSGVTGAVEMSSVNRAVGLLMGRGFRPDEARLRLLEQATLENRPVHQVAHQWLSSPTGPAVPERPASPRPDGDA